MEKLKIIRKIEEEPVVIAESNALKDALNVAEVLSKTNSKILITGEAGVGKSLFARYIHSLSGKGDFYNANCFLLAKKGNFNLDEVKIAGGNTIFFEDFDFLNERQRETVFDFIRRIEAAGVSVMLSAKAQIENPFLSMVSLNIPPLRSRKDDIVPIAKNILKNESIFSSKNISDFTEGAKNALSSASWFGNCDELAAVVKKAIVVAKDSFITEEDLAFNVPVSQFASGANGGQCTENQISDRINVVLSSEDKTLKTALNNFKRAYVLKILEETSGNQTKAAKIMGIQRTYVSRLLNELNIREK